MFFFRTLNTAHRQRTGTIGGVYSVALHANVAFTRVELQHIIGIGVDIVHLVVVYHHIYHVFNLDGVFGLVAECAVAYGHVARIIHNAAAFNVASYAGTDKSATVDIKVFGIGVRQHRLDSQCRWGITDAIDKAAPREVKPRAVLPCFHHIGERPIDTHKIHIAEPHIGHILKVDRAVLCVVRVAVDNGVLAFHRFEHQVVFVGQS